MEYKLILSERYLAAFSNKMGRATALVIMQIIKQLLNNHETLSKSGVWYMITHPHPQGLR